MDSFTKLKQEVKGTVLEFFLGKNIIAKIAVFLLFLGVLSFGQLAYVDWLNDSGRMIFISSIGVVMMVIAFYFERCKSMVFSNVFYLLGIALFLLTIMLGYFTYSLYSIDVMLIQGIVLMISSFIFTSYRRTEFLDASMLVLYSIILSIPYYFIYQGYTNMELLLSTLIITIYSGIFLTIWSSYSSDQQAMKVVLFFIFILSIRHSVFTVGMSHYRYYTFTLQLLYIAKNAIILYGILLSLPSIMNDYIRWIIGVIGVYYLGTVGFSLMIVIEELIRSLDFMTALAIGWVILYSPLHIWYSCKQKNVLSIIFLSAAMIGVLLVSLIGGDQLFDFYSLLTLNWISITFVLIFLASYIVTSKKRYYVSSSILLFIITIRVIVYMASSHTIGFHDFDVFIPTLTIGLIFTILPSILRPQLPHDRFIVFGLLHMLASLIVVVFVFVEEWIIFDSIIYVSFAALTLIGYRYLLHVSVFQNRYTRILKSFIQIKIILVVFLMNFHYFNHNFALWNDILFFLLTFGLNAYIVISFSELYKHTEVGLDPEVKFIVFYILGAIVQSIWIHRYINVEFDKVILSSYFMIASAIGILIGFRNNWEIARKIGLGVIYFSLLKFFIYDFFTQDFTTVVRMITYFILGFTLLGISFLYSYLEKTYGTNINSTS